MYQAKQKKIDGLEVTVVEWAARKALINKLKLFKIFGPSLAKIIGTFKDGVANMIDSDVDFDIISEAFEGILSKLDEHEFTSLISLLMSSVTVNDQAMSDDDDFDLLFAGNLISFYKISWFVLEVNYGSFFGEKGIGTYLTKAKTKNKTQLSPEQQNISQVK